MGASVTRGACAESLASAAVGLVGDSQAGCRSESLQAHQPRRWLAPHGRGGFRPSALDGGKVICSWAASAMTSLEGINAPARADSGAPSGLTSLHREAPSSTLA